MPEEITPPLQVNSQQRIMPVLSDDDCGQRISSSVVSVKLSSNDTRHSAARCIATDLLPQSSGAQNAAHKNTSEARLHTNDTLSTAERRLPRRATTRRAKLSRKSTRRIRPHITDTSISEFDDDSYVDANNDESLQFSETDSEPNEDDHASGSDESDLEFETELAQRMNISQVCCCEFVNCQN